MNCEYFIKKFSSYKAKERHAVTYIDSVILTPYDIGNLINNTFYDRMFDVGLGDPQFCLVHESSYILSILFYFDQEVIW